MDNLRDFNLIYFLDFYFAFMFLISLVRRFSQYQAIGKLALDGPLRWPRLLRLIQKHRMVFLTWATLTPAILALAVWLLQLVASRMVWPEAGTPPYGLTLGKLFVHWPALFFVAPLGTGMFGVDLYCTFLVGKVDRELLGKYFDQAEYWLASPTAHVVRVVTFGFVNPRKMVADEVRKALVAASNLINASLWWWNLQVTLRFLCGLSLWITWAFSE